MQEILSKEAREIIKANPLFAGLSEPMMGELLDLMYEERVSVGVNIVQEGQPGDSLYIIRAGRAEVLKEDDHGEYHHIAMLKPGDVIGEISLIDRRPRSATVRAVETTQLIAVKFDELYKRSKPETSLINMLKVNFAQSLSANIRKLNTRTVNKLKDQLRFSQKQVHMGHYVFNLMTLVCLYVLAMSIFNSVVSLEPATAYLSVPVVYLFGFGFYNLIRKSEFPMKNFGVTLEGWEYAIKDSFILTLLVMCPLVLVAKLIAVAVVPKMAGASTFYYAGILSALSQKERFILMLSFVCYAPVIEFMARGVAQTSFMVFISDRSRKWQSIVLAAMFFSLTHAHISIALALATFGMSLFWGWLFTRHTTLVGVMLSHLILGGFALFIVGFDF